VTSESECRIGRDDSIENIEWGSAAPFGKLFGHSVFICERSRLHLELCRIPFRAHLYKKMTIS